MGRQLRRKDLRQAEFSFDSTKISGHKISNLFTPPIAVEILAPGRDFEIEAEDAEGLEV